jgi:virginiamycin B lyase
VLGSRFGAWCLVRTAAALVTFCLLRAPVRRARLREVLAAPVLLGAAVSFAATSHGAASSRPLWGAAFDFVHLLAAVLWIGGVAGLALVWPALTGSGAAPTRTRILKRCSLLFGAAVPVVLLTGLANGAVELGRLGDLFDFGYGNALLVKLGLVVLLVAVAGVNAAIALGMPLPVRTWGRFVRMALIGEVVVGVAVFGAAAAMSAQAPSRAQDEARTVAAQLAADPNPASSFSGNTELAGRAALLTLTPATVGTNALRIELTGRGGPPSLRVRLAGPDGRAADATLVAAGTEDQGHGATADVYQGAVRLDGPAGVWQAVEKAPDGQSAVPLTIPVASPAPGGLPATGGPSIAALAAIALAALAAVAAILSRLLPRPALRLPGVAVSGGAMAVALGAGVVAAVGSPSRTVPGGWGTLTAVQPSTYQELRYWRVPTGSSGLMTPAVGPDGSVWVGEMDTNRLARLLPDGKAVQEFLFSGGYQGTMGVAVDSSNHVWLAQESAGTLGRFDPATGGYQAIALPTPASGPSGIALAPDGSVWLTEISSGKLARYDPASGNVTEFPVPGENPAVYWPAVAPDGTVGFTELGAKAAGLLDPRDGSVRTFPTPDALVPTGIAADRTGAFWIATTDGMVLRLDPRTGAFTSFEAPVRQLYGVVDAGGRIWLGSAAGDAVVALDPASGAFTRYAVPAGSGPWWPAVGSDGGVWFVLGTKEFNAVGRLQSP